MVVWKWGGSLQPEDRGCFPQWLVNLFVIKDKGARIEDNRAHLRGTNYDEVDNFYSGVILTASWKPNWKVLSNKHKVTGDTTAEISWIWIHSAQKFLLKYQPILHENNGIVRNRQDPIALTEIL